jgi:hypothetical protein
MRLRTSAQIACLFIVGYWTSLAAHARAADVMPSFRLTLPKWESPVKEIQLRKIASKLLRLGASDGQNDAIWIGPARARLLWKQKWSWSGSGSGSGARAAQDHGIAAGLVGGPILSFDIPLGPLAALVSLETQFCSLRYRYSDASTGRTLIDELADPRAQRQSLEGGLYLNIALGTLF